MPARRSWSQEDDAKLSDMWMSHSAGTLAPLFKCSRNAVIGRAHRIGLAKKGRSSPIDHSKFKKSAPERVPPQGALGVAERLVSRPSGKIDTSITTRPAPFGGFDGKPSTLSVSAGGAKMKRDCRSVSGRAAAIAGIMNTKETQAVTIPVRRLPAADTGAGVVLPRQPAPVPLMLALTELNSKTCRFPYGDPKQEGFGFCGHQTRSGSPFCEFHHGVSFIKPGRLHA